MDELQRLQETNDLLIKSIVDIMGETYRFKRVFIKAVSKLEVEDQNKYASQFAWFTKRVDKAAENAGLSIVDLSGQEFDPGMAVTAMNIDDFEPDDDLFIEQMMEPVIMKDGKVQKTGTVVLGRFEK